MSTLAEQFAVRDKNIPKPTYNYGDRVFAKFSGIPVIGMVVRETDKMVLIHIDLPIKVDEEIRHIITVPVKGIKKLKEIA